MADETMRDPVDDKDAQLAPHRRRNRGEPMTEESGTKIADDQQTLRAGRRGPLLMQDFHFYKKQSTFSRERIPEKVVHARGFGVYGEFELTESLEEHTSARLFCETGEKTPVFVRFSNFTGNKGSKDTAVDIRGFAVKFYTEEGNYDQLSLQFPVFILADAMKFMDVAHAAKQNPVTDIPQATVAHDNFWDYVTSNPESAHMVMWLMSMRGRPRSWRMMEGYPVNTFRFVNAAGESCFVRFVWKPKLGVHGLTLEETNIIGGVDPDFHRRDMIDAIGNGVFPEYDLGVQIVPEADEFAYDFDLLDDTKLWPEEEIPPRYVGKMTLNRLVDNFFAEEEQSVFNPANLVPGIEFTNDPVLQGRSFAYRDTELYRQQSANYENLPVNRPINEVANNYRDGHLRYAIDTDEVHMHRNTAADNTPSETSAADGGYENYPAEVEGTVTREHPSDRFLDHFSQARIFWNSLAMPEKRDLIESFSFHVGSVQSIDLRQNTVEMFGNVDRAFATMLAENIGVEPPQSTHVDDDRSYASLSQLSSPHSAVSLKVAVLIGNGFADAEVSEALAAMEENGAMVDIVSEALMPLTGADGMELVPNKAFIGVHPALYDACYVVGGESKNQRKFDQAVTEFVDLQYMNFAPIGVATTGEAHVVEREGRNMEGVIRAGESDRFTELFAEALATIRFWDRT